MCERAAFIAVLLLIFLALQILSSFFFNDESEKASADMRYVIWQDCMRLGPVPVIWRFYQFTGRWIYSGNTMCSLVGKGCVVSKINRISLKTSPVSRFFGTGSLILYVSKSENFQSIVLKGIKSPERTKEMLEKWIRLEKNRQKKSKYER